MNIVNKKIKDLRHAEYNPRQISEEDFAQLKRSLTDFEAVQPAVINQHPGRENIIVGGNQRVRAASAMGWKEFPCVEVNLNEEKERELNIRLNRNLGEWDFDSLANNFDVGDLVEWGFNEEELTGSDIEKLNEKEEELKPYKQAHVLISFHPDLFGEVQGLITQLKNIEGVEIEQSAN